MFETVILGGSDLVTPVLLGGFKHGRGLQWHFRTLFKYVLEVCSYLSMCPNRDASPCLAWRRKNKEGRDNFWYRNAYFLLLRWDSNFGESSLLIAHVGKTIKDVTFACAAVIRGNRSVWVCIYFTGNCLFGVFFVPSHHATVGHLLPVRPWLSSRQVCSGKHRILCATTQQGWTTRWHTSLINRGVI